MLLQKYEFVLFLHQSSFAQNIVYQYLRQYSTALMLVLYVCHSNLTCCHIICSSMCKMSLLAYTVGVSRGDGKDPGGILDYLLCPACGCSSKNIPTVEKQACCELTFYRKRGRWEASCILDAHCHLISVMENYIWCCWVSQETSHPELAAACCQFNQAVWKFMLSETLKGWWIFLKLNTVKVDSSFMII